MSFSVVRLRVGYISFIALEGISSKVGGVSENLPRVAAEVPRTPYAGEIVTHLNQDHVERLTGVFKDIGAQDWLQQNPLARLELTREVLDGGQQVNGLYDFQNQVIQVATTRQKAEYRKKFEWQRVYSVSVTGDSQAEAVRRTLVHELGHHIHNTLRKVDPEQFLQTTRANYLASGTQYGQKNTREYFAESFALYTYQSSLLIERDPQGHAMIKTALKRMELEVNPL